MEDNNYNLYRFFKGDLESGNALINEMSQSMNKDKWLEENWDDYVRQRKLEKERSLNDFLSDIF